MGKLNLSTTTQNNSNLESFFQQRVNRFLKTHTKSNNIIDEYDVLVNELRLYNPELLDKEKMLAITKCDLIDEELKEEIQKELPDKIQTVFISSVAQTGLIKLKDEIWKMINYELD